MDAKRNCEASKYVFNISVIISYASPTRKGQRCCGLIRSTKKGQRHEKSCAQTCNFPRADVKAGIGCKHWTKR